MTISSTLKPDRFLSILRRVGCVCCATFALMLWVAACGDDGAGPEEPSLTGTWQDTTLEIDGYTFDFQLMLNQAGSSVSGSSTLNVGGVISGSGPVTGTYSHPDVRLSSPLTMNFAGSSLTTNCTFTATANNARDSMRGRLFCQEAVAGDFSMEEVRVDLTMTKQ